MISEHDSKYVTNVINGHKLQVSLCYLLATDESWSRIFDSPSNIVSRVSLDSSTLMLETFGTWSTRNGLSWTCSK